MTTALRETREESGLHETDFKVDTGAERVLKYDVKGKPKTVKYWLAELTNGSAEVKLSDEHQDYKWLEVDDACKLSQFDDMQKMLRQYQEYLVSS